MTPEIWQHEEVTGLLVALVKAGAARSAMTPAAPIPLVGVPALFRPVLRQTMGHPGRECVVRQLEVNLALADLKSRNFLVAHRY